MEDAHDFCNAEHYQKQDFLINDFLFNLRIFRQRNHWLSKNLYKNSNSETIPMYGATVYKIRRFNPETNQFWTFYGNMEGESIEIQIPDYKSVVIKTPNALVEKNKVILSNSEAVIICEFL
jgi:hypothetical protein